MSIFVCENDSPMELQHLTILIGCTCDIGKISLLENNLFQSYDVGCIRTAPRKKGPGPDKGQCLKGQVEINSLSTSLNKRNKHIVLLKFNNLLICCEILNTKLS